MFLIAIAVAVAVGVGAVGAVVVVVAATDQTCRVARVAFELALGPQLSRGPYQASLYGEFAPTPEPCANVTAAAEEKAALGTL